MRDASTGRYVPDADANVDADSDAAGRQERASLAPTQDDDASPQGRDEKPLAVGREAFREEPDAKAVQDFVQEYRENPLIRVPIQNFAADVLEPGISVAADVDTGADGDGDAPAEADEGEEEIPTVPADGGRIPEQYHDLPVDDALELWLANAYIDGFDFDADATDLLEAVVKDRRGRRGTAIVEHAYDDPRERERLMALRPLRVETVTAYTREGKAIALRPDDDPHEFDSVAVRDLGNPSRSRAPRTPAGKTAAIAQFDDVFGSDERDEIPFALDDITVSAYDADTGKLFGRPDSATVLNRAAALRKKLRHVDQSVINTAFGNIIATVDTNDEDIVRNVRDNLDVNVKDRGENVDPETVSATNAPVDVTEVDGQVPDIVDIIQQEIEFVLSAMPTPLYRVGFAGDINRDVTGEQQEDYRDEVKRERRRIEADFQGVLEAKVREWLLGTPHADGDLGVEVQLRIRPSQAESPLRDEEFDEQAFSQFASGLKQIAPGGAVGQVLPPHELREMILDISPEPPAPPGDDGDGAGAGGGGGPVGALTPEQVGEDAQEAFAELYGLDAAAGATDADQGQEADLADGPFSNIPVLPDNLPRLTKPWLVRWVLWVLADRPEIDEEDRLAARSAERARLDWNPTLHPRDPKTGKFVERPFDLPDSIDPDEIAAEPTPRLLQRLDGNGIDVEADLLQNDSIAIDGIPATAETTGDLEELLDEDGPAAETITADDVPELPGGPGGHGDVSQSVLDPGWSQEKVREFREAVDAGDISIGSDLSQDGPLGIDKGVAALAVDAAAAGNPTAYSNLASTGSFDHIQPHIVFEEDAPEFIDRAADRVNARLPDEYEAIAQDGTLRVDKSGADQFIDRRNAIHERAEEMFPASETPVDDYLASAGDEVVERNDLPTNEERAAIDRALMAGVRDELSAVDGEMETVTAADRREAFDTVQLGEELNPERVSEGDLVAYERFGRRRQGEVIMNSPAPEGTPEDRRVRLRRPTGETALLRYGEDLNEGRETQIYETEPVETPDLELEGSWNTEKQRVVAARSAIDEYVATGTDAPLGKDLPVDDAPQDWYTENEQSLARAAAAHKDAEMAEQAIGTLAQLGDEGSRSYAGTEAVAGQRRGYIRLSGTNSDTAAHEYAHQAFNAAGFGGNSGSMGIDYEGEVPDYDLEEVRGEMMITPADQGHSTDPADSLGLEDFEERVDIEVGPDLDGRNFTRPDDFAAWAADADEGAMIRFEDYPLQTFDEDGPRNYRIAETIPADEIDVTNARQGFVLEGPDGEQFRAAATGFGDIKSEDIHETNGFLPEANLKRESTPDGWGGADPDPDAALRRDPAETPQARMRRVAKEANAALLKQHLTSRRHDESAANRTHIKSPYSSVTAHETLAQLHEVMRGDPTSTEADHAAEALVNEHPRLLGAYRDAFEVPASMKARINDKLESRGAEERL